jgi:hypothetical protein
MKAFLVIIAMFLIFGSSQAALIDPNTAINWSKTINHNIVLGSNNGVTQKFAIGTYAGGGLQNSSNTLALKTGVLKVKLAAGTASSTPVTMSGMAVGDELVSIFSFTTAASIASVVDRTAEYTIGTGQLGKASGTNETGNELLIFYLDLT